jgi:uncharacterized protein YdhG (YjbR/CyaY superfamily)
MDSRKKGFSSIDDYIRTFPKEVRGILNGLRATIRAVAPDAGETISYGIPTFVLNGNLVHFAAYKKHIGFYPTSSGIRAFKKELSIYKTSTGTVQFPIGKPLPLALIGRIVAFRVKENNKRHLTGLKKTAKKLT